MSKIFRIAVLLFTTCLLLSFFQAAAPVFLSWNVLQDVEFEEKYVKEVDGPMLFPKFTARMKALNGKQVRIEGYVVPFDPSGARLALSANSYAACFFCGKAGPASVLTVNLRQPNKKFKTDQYRGFTGRLRLNNSDIKEFYYILEDAEMISKK